MFYNMFLSETDDTTCTTCLYNILLEIDNTITCFYNILLETDDRWKEVLLLWTEQAAVWFLHWPPVVFTSSCSPGVAQTLVKAFYCGSWQQLVLVTNASFSTYFVGHKIPIFKVLERLLTVKSINGRISFKIQCT